MTASSTFFHEADPLAPFRNESEDARRLVMLVKRAIQDERVSDLPTRSNLRRGLRRWERIMSHLESSFDHWEMREHKNQARFHSPEGLSQHPSRLIVKTVVRPTENDLKVRNIGKATTELVPSNTQGSLFQGDLSAWTKPLNMLVLGVEYRSETFGGEVVFTATLYIAHVININVADKLLKCSEILELCRWNLDDDQEIVADLPPSRPITPSVTAKNLISQTGS